MDELNRNYRARHVVLGIIRLGLTEDGSGNIANWVAAFFCFVLNGWFLLIGLEGGAGVDLV